MAVDLGWEELAESADAGKASDAAVRVVLEHLNGREDYGACGREVERLLWVMSE